MRVTVADVIAAIDLLLAGQMDAVELEAWAERREMMEDVDYCEFERSLIVDAIFRLANPTINGPITAENVSIMRAKLQR